LGRGRPSWKIEGAEMASAGRVVVVVASSDEKAAAERRVISTIDVIIRRRGSKRARKALREKEILMVF